MKYKLIFLIILAVVVGLTLNYFFGVDVDYCDSLCELRRMG